MWKFDVSDSDPDNWKVAFTANDLPAPFFKARSSSYEINSSYLDPDSNMPISFTITTPADRPQPITAKPEVDQHPNGGIMLYFGTGKYFLNVDNLVDPSQDSVESFYGLWDNCVNYAGGTGTCSSDVPVDQAGKVVKSQLVQQSITFEDINYRVTSKNPVDYAKVNPDKGWYLDLYKGSGYVNGERVVSQPIIRNRRIIFTSLYPDATGLCVAGGSSWLTLLDSLTGKALEASAFVTGSGAEKTPISILVNEVDTSISGVKSDGIIGTTTGIKTNDGTVKLVGIDAKDKIFAPEISEPGGGRQSWLQLR